MGPRLPTVGDPNPALCWVKHCQRHNRCATERCEGFQWKNGLIWNYSIFILLFTCTHGWAFANDSNVCTAPTLDISQMHTPGPARQPSGQLRRPPPRCLHSAAAQPPSGAAAAAVAAHAAVGTLQPPAATTRVGVAPICAAVVRHCASGFPGGPHHLKNIESQKCNSAGAGRGTHP